jgi:hypothetical protein
MDGDDLESRWPQEGDRLFVESNWSTDAYLTSDPAERFYRLPLGYKRAGDLLIDRAAADPLDRANIIYPAIFSYRLSIELFLKKIVDEFGDEDLRQQKKTHELDVLWTRFMQVVAGRGGSDSVGLAIVEKLVDEMNVADAKSDTFRFSTDSAGSPFLFGDRGVDLTVLRESMQGLSNFFECCYLAFKNEDDLIVMG